MTNSLQKRLEQHRRGDGSSFVKAYGIHRLVYGESYDRPDEAVAREKRLKHGSAIGKSSFSNVKISNREILSDLSIQL